VSKYLIPRSRRAIPIHVVTPASYQRWLGNQPQAVVKWLQSVGYKAKPGELRLIPGRNGELGSALISNAALHEPWGYASLPTTLPKQHPYAFAALADDDATAAALGWALGCYSFSRYRKRNDAFASLVWPQKADRRRVIALFEGITLCRNLINTPASDLGPAELTAAGALIAERHGAKSSVIVGEQLLKANYPMVHAVGRASSRAPRLFDLRWGDPKHPKLTLVGKGVCFDSGGLDIKPAADMKLMKKDMGGAALVLGLAHTLMSLDLPVRLRVLVPAVENSVSGNAMRPLDVLPSRKGLTVEIGNTDAEGRLILADALTEASDESPDLLIDAATLTGAARVALGTALPALFCNDDTAADALLTAGKSAGDPLWRLPLHEPYRKSLDSKIANLNNISSDSYAGAITAALFLREFIGKKQPWLHIDTMGWNVEARPGRPYGGEALGLRALVDMLETRYRR
jgi:leucyl aminopeptidase